MSRIAFQLGRHVNFVDCLQGLLLLLKVIIIYRRCNGKLRAGIVEAMKNPRFGQRLLVLADALHASKGTVAVIVEFLVHGGALTYLHHPHIRHQAFQFVVRLGIDLLQKAVRPLEIHADEGTEGQIVQSLRLDVRAASPYLQGLEGIRLGSIQVLVSRFVRPLVERIRLHESISPCPSSTRKERNGSQQASCTRQGQKQFLHLRFFMYS